jgi:hypothetical protein
MLNAVVDFSPSVRDLETSDTSEARSVHTDNFGGLKPQVGRFSLRDKVTYVGTIGQLYARNKNYH